MKKKIIQGILFVLIIIAFIYVGTRDFKTDATLPNEKFDQDYKNVSSDNVFVYVNAQEVLTKLKNGNNIIFMGYPTNKWTGYYANILNEVAKNNKVDSIYYYDFYEDRKNQSGTYQSIVLKLSNYSYTLDDGMQNIYAPTLVFVKNGKIMAVDNETAVSIGINKPDEYWNEYQTGLKANTLDTMFKEFLE